MVGTHLESEHLEGGDSMIRSLTSQSHPQQIWGQPRQQILTQLSPPSQCASHHLIWTALSISWAQSPLIQTPELSLPSSDSAPCIGNVSILELRAQRILLRTLRIETAPGNLMAVGLGGVGSCAQEMLVEAGLGVRRKAPSSPAGQSVTSCIQRG